MCKVVTYNLCTSKVFKSGTQNATDWPNCSTDDRFLLVWSQAVTPILILIMYY